MSFAKFETFLLLSKSAKFKCPLKINNSLIASDPTDYFSLPTYAAAQGLLNNFQKNVTIQETLTSSQLAEQDRFIDAIMETTVMQLTHQFLAGKGTRY